MSEGSIRREIILSGTDSIAAFSDKGQIYRAEPIPNIQEIGFHNLLKDKTRVFRLADRLDKDYEILGILAEIPMTQAEINGTVTDPGNFQMVKLRIRLYSAAKDVSEIALDITPYPFYTNKLFINHRDTWHIKADRDVDNITFMCKPVYLEMPLVFP